jgi:hypothetical protein
VLLFFAVYGLLNFVEVRINAFIERVGMTNAPNNGRKIFVIEKKDNASDEKRKAEQFVKQIVEAWKEGEYTGHGEAFKMAPLIFLIEGDLSSPILNRSHRG